MSRLTRHPWERTGETEWETSVRVSLWVIAVLLFVIVLLLLDAS